jgi:hypothetical protein
LIVFVNVVVIIIIVIPFVVVIRNVKAATWLQTQEGNCKEIFYYPTALLIVHVVSIFSIGNVVS